MNNAAERGRIIARYREILDRTRALPDAAAAGVIRVLPFDGVEQDVHFTIQNRSRVPGATARWQFASPGLMEALQTPLLRGRRFTEADTESGPGAVMINETMARQRFQTQVLAWFAVLALVLGMVGLYGVMSYLVTSSQDWNRHPHGIGRAAKRCVPLPCVASVGAGRRRFNNWARRLRGHPRRPR
jgi:hypothetical protein